MAARNPAYAELNGMTSISKADPNIRKWDLRFLNLARHIAEWSKDPSRKIGAVITRPDRRIVSQGYNGFAIGVEDSPERYADKMTKYEMVVHAEVNAIITAGKDLTGTTLYSTLMPCSRCAAVIINSGIKKVVTIVDDVTVLKFDNTAHSFELSTKQFEEAGVKVVTYNLSELS